MSAPIVWRPAPVAFAVASCGGAALVAGIVAAQWTLVIFAAPLLGVLAAVMWIARAHEVTGSAEPNTLRCFETETVEFHLDAHAVGDATIVATTAEPVRGLTLTSDRKSVV